MKRLISFALAVGLVLAFSMPAAAVDVKFSGQYQFQGWYESNPKLNDLGNPKNSIGYTASSFLLSTQFKVAEGLSLTTRARILDKIWGDKLGTSIQQSTNGTSMDVQNRTYDTSRLMRENIEFDQLYVDAAIGPGLLRAGYTSGVFGTPFLDSDIPSAGISYIYRGIKGWTVVAGWGRPLENEIRQPSLTGVSSANASDLNFDRLSVTAIYGAPTWDAGITYSFLNNHSGSISGSSLYTAPCTGQAHVALAYGRGTFGPLFAEAEVAYNWGDYIDSRDGGTFASAFGASNYPGGPAARSWSSNAKAAHVHARYAMGPAYVGGKFAYVSGDDPTTLDKNEAGTLGSGREFKPCLILINPDRDKYLGALGPGTYGAYPGIPDLINIVANTSGYGNAYGGIGYSNFFLYQGYVGFKPIDKLDVSASYSYVTLDQKPRPNSVVWVDDKVGNEFDVTATYKVFDNLSYMVGFGYLWAGDAWKGTNAAATVGNDWLLMHRLTLSF